MSERDQMLPDNKRLNGCEPAAKAKAKSVSVELRLFTKESFGLECERVMECLRIVRELPVERNSCQSPRVSKMCQTALRQ